MIGDGEHSMRLDDNRKTRRTLTSSPFATKISSLHLSNSALMASSALIRSSAGTSWDASNAAFAARAISSALEGAEEDIVLGVVGVVVVVEAVVRVEMLSVSFQS